MCNFSTKDIGYLLFDDGTKEYMPKGIRIIEQSWVIKIVRDKYDYYNLSDGEGLLHIIEVFIPSSCVVISYNAFLDCQNLCRVIIAKDSDLNIINNNAFCGCNSLLDFDFNSLYDLVYIGEFAFCCSGLQNIEIDKKDIILAKGVFRNCGELKTVDLNGMVIIPEDCFSFCNKLKYVNLGDSIKFIDSNAFKHCNIITFNHAYSPFIDLENRDIKQFFFLKR